MRTRFSALLLALVIALPAFGASIGGVTVPETATVDGHKLVLNGSGLRKKLFIKVYVGSLYLQAKQGDAAGIVAADAPRRQVMHFLYSVSKDQMCEAWNEGLRDNTPTAAASVKSAFQTLCSWMEPIPKGNELVLTYLPGTGTTVEVNGKKKGTLAGKATSDAILVTWIGPKPGPGSDFKAGVLGKGK